MRRAFTLVEVLISLSLVMLILPVFFSSTLRSVGAARRLADRCRRQQAHLIIGERICRDIRGAGEILPSSGTEEVFLRCGSEEISYRLYNGMIRRKAGNVTAYLSEGGEFDRLSFTYPSNEGVTVALNKEVYNVTQRNPLP